MKLKLIDVQHLANPAASPDRRRLRVVLEGEVSEAERKMVIAGFQAGCVVSTIGPLPIETTNG